MIRQLLLAGLACGTLLGAVGCKHCCRRNRDRGYDSVAPPPVGPGLGDPFPSSGGSRIPPPSVPTSPPPTVPDTLPPPVVPDSRSSFRIDPALPPSQWNPTPTAPSSQPTPRTEKKELLVPEPLPGGAPPELPSDRKPITSGFLEEPIPSSGGSDRPPKASSVPPPVISEPAPSKPSLEPPTSSTPVGLPGFARVPGHEGVASGRRPSLDGFDWLKANGYRTVVYLHAPTADVSAARELAEKRGLRFSPIAVSPANLAKALDEFTAVVNDNGARPVYVADENGVRAGALWYLVFRTSDLLGDDTARLRADPLGLTEAGTEEQKQFWLAIQDVLAKR
jgi:hypothetical protein